MKVVGEIEYYPGEIVFLVPPFVLQNAIDIRQPFEDILCSRGVMGNREGYYHGVLLVPEL